MKLFFSYLRQRKSFFAVFALFAGIFFITFWLYHLPAAAVGYPVLLCALFGAGYLIADFFRVRQKHLQLLSVQKLQSDQISTLPPAQTLAEEDYQRILTGLTHECANLKSDADRRYSNMVDYYTVWVHQVKPPIASMALTLQGEDSPLSRNLSSDLFRIEQYVGMVLAFLRMESSSSDYVIQDCDLDALCRQSIRRFSGEFILRKLRLDYTPMVKSVLTDEKWFAFILEQILSNALKYTPAGSIGIYLENEDTLCVTDTGIGIAPEDLPRVFEKGFTGYNGRSDKKASGIGLYLCQRICRKLGHSITITSQVDKGTTVRIGLQRYPFQAE